VAFVVVGVAVALEQIGLVHVLSDDTIDREKVEKAGQRGLLFEGVSASDVSCPGGLEEKTGAKVVCTYTDSLSKLVGSIVNPEQPQAARTGRVEIRISGFKTRPLGQKTWSEPEFAVRVVEPAREPRR
jgi:hypothetical protein